MRFARLLSVSRGARRSMQASEACRAPLHERACETMHSSYRAPPMRTWLLISFVGTLATACLSPSEKTAPPTTVEVSGAASQAAPEGPSSAPRKHGELDVFSSITVAYAEEKCDDQTACLCKGGLRYGENALRRVGVTPEALHVGVPCLIGDYDGNGVADFAVAEPWDEKRASRVMVLMFDGSGLSATAMLPKRVRTLGQRREGSRHMLYEPGPTEKKAHFALRDAAFTYVREP